MPNSVTRGTPQWFLQKFTLWEYGEQVVHFLSKAWSHKISRLIWHTCTCYVLNHFLSMLTYFLNLKCSFQQGWNRSFKILSQLHKLVACCQNVPRKHCKSEIESIFIFYLVFYGTVCTQKSVSLTLTKFKKISFITFMLAIVFVSDCTAFNRKYTGYL